VLEAAQLCVAFPFAWGGARGTWGERRVRASFGGASRARYSAAVPVHVTLRLRVRSLRSQFVFPTVLDVLSPATGVATRDFGSCISVQWTISI
jgi:hypothetical protein